MPRPKHPLIQETLRSWLHEAGLRVTPPRIAVLSALLNANVPRSHTDLVSDPLTLQYDRATLYRNLIDMTEAGLVARNDFGDHVWRFELTRGLIVNGKQVISLPIAAHPHFLCLACEQVRCLPQDSLQLKAEGGLVPEQVHQVLLRGHCEACYPKILANNPPISRQPTGTQAGA